MNSSQLRRTHPHPRWLSETHPPPQDLPCKPKASKCKLPQSKSCSPPWWGKPRFFPRLAQKKLQNHPIWILYDLQIHLLVRISLHPLTCLHTSAYTMLFQEEATNGNHQRPRLSNILEASRPVGVVVAASGVVVSSQSHRDINVFCKWKNEQF